MRFLIPHAVDDHAQSMADAQAVGFAGESLSWAALMTRANRLAHALANTGVGRGDRVGIYMNKSLDTAVAVYGIMKAGAAYVPLDVSAPPLRTAAVLRNCGIRHVVTSQARAPGLETASSEAPELAWLIGPPAEDAATLRRVPWSQVEQLPGNGPPSVRLLGGDLAYIIYTSGSTGVPKGIMHTHDSGLAFARWAVAEYGLTAADRLGNHAPLHFDISIFDFFAGATAGAATILIGEEYLRLPASYSQCLADERISVLFTVPFALIQVLLRGVLEQRDLSALRWVIYGGEPFPVKHLRALMAVLPHARFDNVYGPAEVNGVTRYTVPPLDGTEPAIPIGPLAPIAEGLIFDANDRPVEGGEPGELLVRTPTMMQGYWGQDDLNAAAFWHRPAAGGRRDTFFRTGDLVRESRDGMLWFVGRKDRQAKIRGYRVELDEVEAALACAGGVEEAAAYVLTDDEGVTGIEAQVTVRPQADITTAALDEHLQSRLPWYALPGRVSIRSRFPRTTTGKIDRRALQTEAAKGRETGSGKARD